MKDEKLIAYLRNELPEEENREGEAWISASDEHTGYFHKIKYLWEHSLRDYQDTEFRKDRVWKGIESAVHKDWKIQPRTTSAFKRTLGRIAAAGIILIGTGFLTYRIATNLRSQDSRPVMARATGEIMEIELPDNSRVWLNKGSEVTYPERFRGRSREVIIVGEAYFEVKRKPARPFLVITGNTEVEVLGTSFNVKNDPGPGEIVVSVLTGRVAFSAGDKPGSRILIDPGEQATYRGENGEILIDRNSDSNFLSWKTGILDFDNTPLEDVCRDLSRHYSLTITVGENVPVTQKRLTAKYDHKGLDEVLHILAITLDISYEKAGDSIILKPN